jgi:hypothetical protein
MNVIFKADAPLTWVQPLRQRGIFIGQEGDRCGVRQRRTNAANGHTREGAIGALRGESGR